MILRSEKKIKFWSGVHVFLDVPSMCTNFQGGMRVFLVNLVWNEVN